MLFRSKTSNRRDSGAGGVKRAMDKGTNIAQLGTKRTGARHERMEVRNLRTEARNLGGEKSDSRTKSLDICGNR